MAPDDDEESGQTDEDIITVVDMCGLMSELPVMDWTGLRIVVLEKLRQSSLLRIWNGQLGASARL